jgi:hypothetical protein
MFLLSNFFGQFLLSTGQKARLSLKEPFHYAWLELSGTFKVPDNSSNTFCPVLSNF